MTEHSCTPGKEHKTNKPRPIWRISEKSKGDTSPSDQISRSVVSDSLRPHESQHARPPCPSPTTGVHWDSCLSSQWCHPAISSSVVPFSSCPQSLPASESFPMSQLFAWGGQYVLSTFQNPSCWHPSWLSNACATRKDPESEQNSGTQRTQRLKGPRDNTETNPITRWPETSSHMAEQSFWVPWLCCSLPGCPCPVKFLALSACMSPWTIHFWVLGKSLLSAPGRGHLCCNSYRSLEQSPYPLKRPLSWQPCCS